VIRGDNVHWLGIDKYTFQPDGRRGREDRGRERGREMGRKEEIERGGGDGITVQF